jgi:hypothetical protein
VIEQCLDRAITQSPAAKIDRAHDTRPGERRRSRRGSLQWCSHVPASHGFSTPSS